MKVKVIRIIIGTFGATPRQVKEARGYWNKDKGQRAEENCDRTLRQDIEKRL